MQQAPLHIGVQKTGMRVQGKECSNGRRVHAGGDLEPEPNLTLVLKPEFPITVQWPCFCCLCSLFVLSAPPGGRAGLMGEASLAVVSLSHARGIRCVNTRPCKSEETKKQHEPWDLVDPTPARRPWIRKGQRSEAARRNSARRAEVCAYVHVSVHVCVTDANVWHGALAAHFHFCFST